MRPYPHLTEEGKVRRLRELAAETLDSYDLDVGKVSLVARRTSTTFRVDTRDKQRYALRVGPRRGKLHTQTEVAWLKRLQRDDIPAARPVANRKGRLVTTSGRIGVPGERHCVLFDWIPGRPLGEDATALDYISLGELSARLHEAGSRWRRTRGLQPLVWDRVFYYPDEPPVIYDGRFRHLVTDERRKVIEKVEAKAGKELARIHRELDLSLLHGDLHPWNVHMHEGELHVFDFAEVMRGAPVQDVAITLWRARRHPDYQSFLDAFIEGYRSIREWPVERSGQVNLLMAARSLMVLDYALRRGVASEELVASVVEEMTELV